MGRRSSPQLLFNKLGGVAQPAQLPAQFAQMIPFLAMQNMPAPAGMPLVLPPALVAGLPKAIRNSVDRRDTG